MHERLIHRSASDATRERSRYFSLFFTSAPRRRTLAISQARLSSALHVSPAACFGIGRWHRRRAAQRQATLGGQDSSRPQTCDEGMTRLVSVSRKDFTRTLLGDRGGKVAPTPARRSSHAQLDVGQPLGLSGSVMIILVVLGVVAGLVVVFAKAGTKEAQKAG
jgi:hypothetical protein